MIDEIRSVNVRRVHLMCSTSVTMAMCTPKVLFATLVTTSVILIVALTTVTHVGDLTPSFVKVVQPLRIMPDIRSWGGIPSRDVSSEVSSEVTSYEDYPDVINSSSAEHGIHSVKLFKASGVCNVTRGNKDVTGSEFFSTGNHKMCVAVLTGYPDVARKEYVTRILDNLRRDVVSPEAYDLHVFCQGSCHVTVCEELGHSAIYHEIEKTVHMEMSAEGQTMKDILHPMRWYYLSQNYFFMFEQLFVRRKHPYRQCVILEDDLLLSPDALMYARAGMDLMDKDESVFSVSFFNDHSHIPHAREPSDFRRIDHFSGLGFMISQRGYMSHLRHAWSRNKAWDIMVQWMFNRKGNLVSIQPEIMRAFHESDKSVKNLTQLRKAYPRSAIADTILNQTEYKMDGLTEENYDKLVREHLIQATLIEYMKDAAFFTTNEKLLYTNCTDKESLDRIMTEQHLLGIALGKVVRGVYKHTVFIRLYYAKVLVVCENSPFYAEIPTHSTFDPGTLAITLQRSVKRKYLAPIYALATSYHHVISDLNQSCADACNRKSLSCDSYGLVLLEEGCEVVYYFFKECLTCKASVKHKKAWPRPSIDNEQVCSLGNQLSACDATSPYVKRLCACR